MTDRELIDRIKTMVSNAERGLSYPHLTDNDKTEIRAHAYHFIQMYIRKFAGDDQKKGPENE